MKQVKNKILKISKLSSNKKIAIVASSITVVAGSSFAVFMINNCSECVYKDGAIKITKQEFNEALGARQTFYTYNKQAIDENVVNADVLNQLKEEKKIAKLAKDKKITVSGEEIEALYNERIKQNESEEKLLEKVNNLYGYSKEDYLEVLEKDILREKVL